MRVGCLETRRNGPLTMRRYRRPNGRVVRSMELPWSLWLRVRPSVLRGVRGFEKAEASRDRIADIQALLRAGNKSEWIAAVTGVTPQRVRQIKARLK